MTSYPRLSSGTRFFFAGLGTLGVLACQSTGPNGDLPTELAGFQIVKGPELRTILRTNGLRNYKYGDMIILSNDQVSYGTNKRYRHSLEMTRIIGVYEFRGNSVCHKPDGKEVFTCSSIYKRNGTYLMATKPGFQNLVEIKLQPRLKD